MDSFDFSCCRIDKQKIIQLAEGEYIDRKENIIFLGGQGLGKTHLAIALSVEACKRGYGVMFFTAPGLINEMNEAREKFSLLSLEKGFQEPIWYSSMSLGMFPSVGPGPSFYLSFSHLNMKEDLLSLPLILTLPTGLKFSRMKD